MLLPKIWFVIEASKGLGLLLVRQLLSPGYVVAATSRYTDELKNAVQPTGPDHFLRLQEDLGGEAIVRHALETTVQNFGGLDVVVNNAGYGQLEALEELTDQEARQNFDVNVFGILNVLRHALPAAAGL